MKNCKDLSRYRELVPTKQKEMKAMEEELMQMEQKEPRKIKKLRLGKKGKKGAVLAVVLAVVVLAAVVLPRLGGGAAAAGAGYTVEQAARRDLSVSVTGSAKDVAGRRLPGDAGGDGGHHPQ